MSEPVWGDSQRAMTDVLADTPVDVEGVVRVLGRLQVLLQQVNPADPDNPIADFNYLYLTITEDILERLRAGAFADPEFLTLLDVEFARRYFDALRMWGARSPDTPQAWQVLFRRLLDADVRPLPAAAAGVNAHIGYDLPFALIETWHKLGSTPHHSDQHADYLLINDVFFDNIPELRRGCLNAWQLILDRLNGEIDDWYEERILEFARNLAWRDAERIWAYRNDAEAVESARVVLDRHAAFVGWALLSPAGNFLQ
ncbi:MAG TPA: DUF5995 family protein [Micromonosporaceae bacterium]|nr:DUF5995 family protein [Micromonosporaceae bacterium]